MRTTLALALVVGMGGCLVAAIALAAPAQVRGRVDFHGPSGVFPMLNAKVKLCAASGACTPEAVTGSDGMYYMMVEPGTYQLVINEAAVQQVVIPPGTPLFDISPLPGNR